MAFAKDPQDRRRLAGFIRMRAGRERRRAEQALEAAARESRPDLAAALQEQARVHHDAEIFYVQQAERFEGRAAQDEARRAVPHLTLVADRPRG